MKLQDINLAPTFKKNVDARQDSPVRMGNEAAKASDKLTSELDKLSNDENPNISYDSIDRIMKQICGEEGCNTKQLHDHFVSSKGMSPDEYVRLAIAKNSKKILDESYTDRVKEVADAIIKRSQTIPFKKEELTHWIEVEAGYKRIPELAFKDRKGSKAWPDFVKDVLADLKGKVVLDRKRGPSTSAADRRERKAKMLSVIATHIENATGESFPDGDPWDRIASRLRRMGIDEYDFGKWMDAAVKAHLGAKSYNDYMGKFYDDAAADNPELMLDAGVLFNPYTNKPLNYVNQIDYLFANGKAGLALNVIAMLGPRVFDAKKPVENNKATIVKELTKLVKTNRYPPLVNDVIRNIKHMGLEWPEISALETSMQRNNIREHLEPGDVLMVEGSKEAVVGTVLSVDGGTIIIEGSVYPFNEDDVPEGDVVHTRFATRQAQTGRTPYAYNSDIAADIPMYDPNGRGGTWHKLSQHVQGDEVPFSSFEVKEVNDRVAHIIGISPDGKKVQVSTTVPQLAHALADAYNRGGFTDQDIEKVPFRETKQRLDPKCWKGYRKQGTKIKNGIRVNNCVPKESIEEAKYQGREVKLGKPMSGDVKKYKVYVKDPKTGNIKKVNFGDKGMEIKRDDPERRKNFRARHGCGTPRASDRTKAAYWSCRMWSSKPVSKILKGK